MSVGTLKLSGFEIQGLGNTIDFSSLVGIGGRHVLSTDLDPTALRSSLDQLRWRQGGFSSEARVGLGGALFRRLPVKRPALMCASFEGDYKKFPSELLYNSVIRLRDGSVFIAGDIRLNFPGDLKIEGMGRLDGWTASLKTTTPWTLVLPTLGEITFEAGAEIKIGHDLTIIATSAGESSLTIQGDQLCLQANSCHSLTFDENGLKELNLTLSRPLTIRVGNRTLVSDDVHFRFAHTGFNFSPSEEVLIGSKTCQLSFKKGQGFEVLSSSVKTLSFYFAALTLSDGRTISFEGTTHVDIDPLTEAILKVTSDYAVLDDRGMKIKLTGDLPLVGGRLTEIRGELSKAYRIDDENIFNVYSTVNVHPDGSRTLVIRDSGNTLMGESLKYGQIYTVTLSANGQVTDYSSGVSTAS